ncbi:LacI family DNA-binding transcriptional regulator [Mobiluncus curtisii]|uniref:LacI family DNA-binding transcriptional regulator n=1 Tax=Mobiluncus curtisii TaxID=2051 RepID=UPI00242FE568|nr:LacI family DNA-binding transcriptional regulator [Mobiluncus curtisii]
MCEVSDSAVLVKKRVTLDDVAKVAHVATSTASRALNRPGRINAETEALVRQVAIELGYERPENFWLRTHVLTQKVGVMIALEQYRMLAAIQDKLILEHYLPVLYPTVPNQSARIIKREFNNVDGLIIDNPQTPGRIHLEIPNTEPLVVTNCVIDEATCVVPDTEQGVAVLLTHLKSLRHRSITFFYAKDCWLGESILQALQSGCEQAGVILHPVGNVGNNLEAGARAVAAWCRHKDSAAVFCGDYSALGFMQELNRSLKMLVPDDVSVVAIGDAFIGRLCPSVTTTLEVPYRRIGTEAVRQLLSQIYHPSGRERRVKPMKMSLVNGGTTGIS